VRGSEVMLSKPAEELRWLEDQQRLRKRRRGVLAAAAIACGTRLCGMLRDAERGHRPACRRDRIGRPRRLLVLDDTHPSMAGAAADTPWITCSLPAATPPSAMSMVAGVGDQTAASRREMNFAALRSLDAKAGGARVKSS